MSFILLGILNAQAEAAAAGSYDLLETQVLASSASSVTFTGLGSYSDYKHLQIRYVARTDRGAVSDEAYLRFNSDTSASYAKHRLGGLGSSVTARALASQTRIELEFLSGGTNTANSFAGGVLDILDFSDASKNTTVRLLNGVTGAFNAIGLQSGLYFKTDAITSFTLDQITGPNFVAGSRFSLYGIKAA